MVRREAKQEAEAGAEVKRGKKETEDGKWEVGSGKWEVEAEAEAEATLASRIHRPLTSRQIANR